MRSITPQQKHFLFLLSILFATLIVFKLLYPIVYSSFDFNRLWPLERAEKISESIESLANKDNHNFILGSCGGESSIRADILSKLTGKSWYNFTLRGAQPSFHLALLQKLKNENVKPDKVIFVIEPTDLTVQQEVLSKRFVTSDFDRRLYSYSDVFKNDQPWSSKLDAVFIKAVFSDILPWFFTETLLMQFSPKSLNEMKQYRAFTIDRSFEDFHPLNPETKGTITFNYPHATGLIELQQKFLQQNFDHYLNYSEKLEGRYSLKLSPKLINEVIAVIEEFQKYSKEVIVVFPPEMTRLFDIAPGRNNKIESFAEAFEFKKIKTLNASEMKLNTMNPYLDFDHLTYSAAEEFTQKMSEALELAK